MIALLQRVSSASVTVDNALIGKIDGGLLALIAVHRDDTTATIARMSERILGYRMFSDAQGRMNHSIQDVEGDLLLVPQFTLTADTRKGTRASFTRGAAPEMASDFFDQLVVQCRASVARVETGRFGANMQVALVNDGPVTFWLEA